MRDLSFRWSRVFSLVCEKVSLSVTHNLFVIVVNFLVTLLMNKCTSVFMDDWNLDESHAIIETTFGKICILIKNINEILLYVIDCG